MTAARAKEAATQRIGEIERDVVGLSRRIHSRPELAFEETRAAAWVAEAAQAWTGCDPTVGVGGLPTALSATAGSGDLSVTLCAEYDALPGIGHACGHNVIAAASAGAFAALAPIADDLGLQVRLLGTPAEESGGGKQHLIDAGVFEGTHAAMMIHPSTRELLGMNSYASNAVWVEFEGSEAHASISPHMGVNALDAMTVMLTAIGLARQQLEPEQQIHGFVREAGVAANIIPGRAAGTWMARGADLDSLRRAVGIITRCAEAGALAAGAELRATVGRHPYADMRSDLDLRALYRDNAAAIGRNPEEHASRGGSTDMGNVSQLVPAIHPMVSLGDYDVSSHTEPFAELAGGAPGDRVALDGALLLAATVIDAATTPSVRQRLLTGRADAREPSGPVAEA
ncbi:amidohydrolase [Pseudonocardia sp. ICBG601]|uniref:amidohydrolase n=1 Tax=Pseudonocardia sp. ICBG601 TaxID=2846759 RepID=UPI001CF624B4|nr:amidohydrolase [Pseudonocardia sp. ICBG601]